MLSGYLLAVFQYLRAGDDRLIHTTTLHLTLCYLNESTISQVVDDVFDILLVIADRLTCQRVAVDEDFLLLLFDLVILSDVDDIIRYPRKQPCIVRILERWQGVRINTVILCELFPAIARQGVNHRAVLSVALIHLLAVGVPYDV